MAAAEGGKADGDDDDDGDNEDLLSRLLLVVLLLLCWSRLLRRLRLVGLVAAGIMVEKRDIFCRESEGGK